MTVITFIRLELIFAVLQLIVIPAVTCKWIETRTLKTFGVTKNKLTGYNFKITDCICEKILMKFLPYAIIGKMFIISICGVKLIAHENPSMSHLISVSAMIHVLMELACFFANLIGGEYTLMAEDVKYEIRNATVIKNRKIKVN